MIVDLNLQGKTVIVIGGGNESEKRINSLIKQGCKIIVISDSVNSKINNLSKTKIITLNEKIIRDAKKKNILVYSSDNPENSDFSNPAIMDFEKMIQIAIFTGGRSPMMSKKLKIKSEKIFQKIITKEDINQIKIQKIARGLAKETIPTQSQRRKYLQNIMSDNEIDQLIKDSHIKKAEKRAKAILENWK